MARPTKPRNNIRECTSRNRNRSDVGTQPKAVGWRADGQRFDNFVITHWIDHVRGVATDSDKEAVKRHLAEGCDSCGHLVALLNRIWKTSSGAQTVPEALVESAKAVFQRVPRLGHGLPPPAPMKIGPRAGACRDPGRSSDDTSARPALGSCTSQIA
jgi:hypothetical protein